MNNNKKNSKMSEKINIIQWQLMEKVKYKF
jgi:hypothetical protein